MGPTQLEVIEIKLSKGEPLTLDDRVYWHEAKSMGTRYNQIEPFITTAEQTLTFLAKHGLYKNCEQLSEWLDKHGVPK